MDSRTALELTKLKMQLQILETLVLRHDVLVPVFSGKQDIASSVQRTLKVLEESASFVELHFLSDPSSQDLDVAERALYADEFREIVERMKAYVKTISDNLKK